MNYYIINGHTIGSNSEGNAIIEYYRVCEQVEKAQSITVKLETNE